MRITSKGQITIPQELRKKLGFLPGTEVDFEIAGKSIKVVKRKGDNSRGWRIVEHLRGRGEGRMTTDEILSLMRGDD